MGQDEWQFRVINCDIVTEHGVAIFAACAGENARAGMHHHRDAALLATGVKLKQCGVAIDVRVGREQLMRRMNFDSVKLEIIKEIGDFLYRVFDKARVQTAKGQNARRVLVAVGRDEIIYIMMKTHQIL